MLYEVITRESEEYGAKTLLIHKRQRPENSFNRSYISAQLNTEGEFFISSRYVGEEHIYHKQIKVYDKESKILSEEIEKDDFQNRHFDDGEFKWEVVQYKDGKDNGVVDFIASNVDKPLKVEFIGKKHRITSYNVCYTKLLRCLWFYPSLNQLLHVVPCIRHKNR